MISTPPSLRSHAVNTTLLIPDGPLHPPLAGRRARFAVPAAALLAGTVLSLGGTVARAANAELDVLNSKTDLTAAASYSQNMAPSSAKDVTFLAQAGVAFSPSTFTIGGNALMGSIDDLNTAGAITITNNTATATLMLGTGVTSSDGVAAANGGSGADLLFVAAGGSLAIKSGTATLGVTLIADGNFDVGTGGALTIGSVVTGAFGVTKIGAGTLTLTGANTFGGAGQTFINYAGTTTFSGAAGADTAATPFTIAGGSFILDNTTAAGGNNNNRLNDASAIALGAGSFIYRGADATGTNSTETVGALSGGGGTVSLVAGSTNTAQVTAASYTHAAGGGTELVNGVSLGASTTAANRFILTTAPTLVGTTAPLATGINAGVANTSIVPFLVGEATATTGGLGTATGAANTFVTYVAGSGLRPLNPTDEFTNNTVTAGNNTYITAATSAAASTAINSLVINGGDLTVGTGTTLTNTSGALLFASNNSILATDATSLYAGAAENQVTVNAGVTGTIATVIGGGTTALTKSGAGTLVLSGVNTYTGATTVVGGTLSLGVNNALAAGTAVVLGNAGNTGNLSLGSFSQTTGVTSLTIASAGTAPSTVTIGAGQTLAVAGNVTIGAGNVGAANSDTPTVATFTGGGTFAVTSTGGTFQVGAASGGLFENSPTLDLRGLSTFTANLGTAGTFRVGDNNTGGPSAGNGTTTVFLAPTSAITANVLGIADATGYSGTDVGGAGQVLRLGSTSNTLDVNTINISSTTNGNSGADRGQGVLNFATTTGTVTIGGAAGGTTRAVLNEGVNATPNSSNPATVDFTGHSATILLSALTIADRTGTGTNGNVATFSYDTGTLNVSGITAVGQRSGATTGGTTGDVGTLNLGNTGLTSTTTLGTLTVGNSTGAAAGIATGTVNVKGGATTSGVITLGTSTQAGATGTGTLNVSGGTVTTSGITLGTASNATAVATGTVNLTGGTLTMTGNIVRGTATGTSAAVLNLNGGTLDLGGKTIGTAANPLTTTTFAAGTLQNVAELNGGGTLTKTTAGILTIAGTNTYTGATAVNAGTLLVNGTTAAASAVTVGNAAGMLTGTLGGTGTVGGTVAVSSGSILSPGTATTVGTLMTGAVTLATGSTFNALLAGPATGFYSTLVAAGTTSLTGAAFTLALMPGATFDSAGDVLTLIGSPVSGTFSNTNYTTGGYTFTADYSGSGFEVDVTAVPEPSTWACSLAGLVFLGGAARRRSGAARAGRAS